MHPAGAFFLRLCGLLLPMAAAAQVCSLPIAAADTGSVAASVGNGSPASCTEAALRRAVQAHAVVRFDCGAGPATISIATTIELPAARDTVIDGGNRITLDGGGRARIFRLFHAGYRSNRMGLTLQHIALRNGKAPGAGYVAPDPANPACAHGYAEGSGAAILVRDARLHVIDVAFEANAAATPGPDVGGGAIYAAGSLDVLIAGSRFTGNSGANAGAVGALQSNVRIVDSSFSGNSANGIGQNTAGGDAAGCKGVGHPGQGGAGGNGGAVAIDGSDDTDVLVCRSRFSGNHANELAGALFRTANGAARKTTLERSTFEGNSAGQGGALFIMNSAPLEITASTFGGNTAAAFGAAQLQNTEFRIVGSRFVGNEATRGPAGALFLAGSSAASLIRDSVFIANPAGSGGGAGCFGTAIAGDSGFEVAGSLFADRVFAADAPSAPISAGPPPKRPAPAPRPCERRLRAPASPPPAAPPAAALQSARPR